MIRAVVTTPRRSSSRRNRRVSSAAITSACVSSATSRGEASLTSPIGVAASTTTPAKRCSATASALQTSLSTRKPVMAPVGSVRRRAISDGRSRYTYDGRVTRQVLEAEAGFVGPAAAVAPGSPAPRVLPERPINPPTTIERLRVAMPSDRLNGWIVTLIIGAIAFVIRVVNLGYPNKLVFDETYYAKDAYSLLKFGYERNWPSDANSKIITGDVDLMQDTAAFIVHPQLGKWLIAGGEYLFGMNSFGWRFASLLFGTLLIMVTIRLVRRVSRSTLIGGFAGILLTFDGLEFVMSRTALLDIFLAFFLVAAVACLAADRDWFRNRLARIWSSVRSPTSVLSSARLSRCGRGASPLGSASAWPSAASGTRCTRLPHLPCFRWRGMWEREVWLGLADARSGRSCEMEFPLSSLWSSSAWWSMSAPGPAGC